LIHFYKRFVFKKKFNLIMDNNQEELIALLLARVHQKSGEKIRSFVCTFQSWVT